MTLQPPGGSIESLTETIIVGYDGEAPAERALAWAIDAARARQAALVVVAVAEMPFDPEGPQSLATYDDGAPYVLPPIAPPEEARLLATARERIEAEGVSAEYVWAAGNPAQALVGIARERRATLVVLGAHHHSLLGRLLGADVAGQVERQLGANTVVVS
jgi:nucleotide-binding universal stress UspA family protein